MKKIFASFLLCFFCTVSHATTYSMPAPGDDIVGENLTLTVQPGDTWASLSQRYDVSWYELYEANQHLNPRYLLAHQKVVIPQQHILPYYRHGIVINLSELRLYYFSPDGKRVMTYPVSLGRRDWRTPLGLTYVISKEANPTWHVPYNIREFSLKNRGIELPREVGPGPDNPLGKYAIYLGIKGYMIHGTNQPWTIGHYISSGCIRLSQADIKELFSLVKHGDQVHILNHPVKAGWKGNVLYMKAQLPLRLKADIGPYNYYQATPALKEATEERVALIDWHRIKPILAKQNGIPDKVGYAYHETLKVKTDEPSVDTVPEDQAFDASQILSAT